MTHRLENILLVYLNHRLDSGIPNHNREQTLKAMLEDMRADAEESLSYKYTIIWLNKKYSRYSKSGIMERYAHIQLFSEWANSFDTRHQCLPKQSYRSPRRSPNILTTEEVTFLMREMAAFTSQRGLKGYTASTMTGLMYATGLRIGEALALQREDVNHENSSIYVMEGKSLADRYIPISPSTKRVLAAYERKRDKVFPGVKGNYFLFGRGPVKTARSYRDVYTKVMKRQDVSNFLQVANRDYPIRPHDLRHSFAVNSLMKCYDEGRDISEEASKLTIVLGHKTVTESYWYIEAVPQLIDKAIKRSSK